jgi:hypothetical protein
VAFVFTNGVRAGRPTAQIDLSAVSSPLLEIGRDDFSTTWQHRHNKLRQRVALGGAIDRECTERRRAETGSNMSRGETTTANGARENHGERHGIRLTHNGGATRKERTAQERRQNGRGRKRHERQPGNEEGER